MGELFRALDHAYGGGHARQALVRYLEHEAEPMLRGAYGEQTGRRLFAAAADLTRLAGWTSYDIGAHGLAQRYFVQALRLSQAAGDRAYGSYVLVTMSRQAVYLGHGREAVQLARVAQQGVGSSVPPVVQALLHSVEARGHGVLGEVRACTASLVRAERALESARPGTRPRTGRGSSTRRSSPTSSGTATGICSSTGPRRSTPSARCSCGRPASRAAGCSAGWCSPRHGSGSVSSTRPACWAPRPRGRRRRCGRSGPSSTYGTSSGGSNRTGTRHPYGATGIGWRPWADSGRRFQRLLRRGRTGAQVHQEGVGGPAARMQGALDRAGVPVVPRRRTGPPGGAQGGAGRAAGHRGDRVTGVVDREEFPAGRRRAVETGQLGADRGVQMGGGRGVPSTVEETSARPAGARDGSTWLMTAVCATGPLRSASSSRAGSVNGGSSVVWCRTVTGWKAGTRRPGSSRAAARLRSPAGWPGS